MYMRPRPEFLPSKMAQPDAPHMGGIELALARNTSGLVHYAAPTVRTWAWVDPEAAPQAILTAAQTWTAFDMVNGAITCGMQLPYVSHEMSTVIRGIAYVGVPRLRNIQVRLTTADLITAATPADGPGSQPADAAGATGLLAGNWQLRGPGLGISNMVRLAVELDCDRSSGNIPADNGVAIMLEAQWINAEYVSSTTAEVPCYLYALQLWDELESVPR